MRGGRRTLAWVVLALSELLEVFVGGMSALHTTLHSLHPLDTAHPKLRRGRHVQRR